MARDFLTDEQVEMEIERLSKSPEVKLARKEQRLKYKRRQQLYQLRFLESRGKQLAAQGITVENIESMLLQLERDLKGNYADDMQLGRQHKIFAAAAHIPKEEYESIFFADAMPQ